MEGYLVHSGINIARGGSLRIDDGAGLYVYVREGEVWITQDGDRRDHVVAAGEGFRLDCGGKAVVEATSYAIATLTAPMPSNYARRITLQPGGEGAQRLLYDAAMERGSWLGSLRYRFRFL
jgi:hypothetical protein